MLHACIATVVLYERILCFHVREHSVKQSVHTCVLLSGGEHCTKQSMCSLQHFEEVRTVHAVM